MEFIDHLQNVPTYNYDSLTELHTPKITAITIHIKSSQFGMSLPVVAWWRIPTISSRSYQLATVSQLPPTLPTAVSRHSSNGSWPSLYSIGTDCTENTASKRVRVCCGQYLATAFVYRVTTWQRPLSSCLFLCRCLATGLHNTFSLISSLRFSVVA
jgi:hypothetical protein